MTIRPVTRLSKARPTLEGAGVRLYRAIGFLGADEDTDPVLLLDDFRSDVPADYAAGFPWHPHRGMETITYVLAGTVEHRDSLGHQGVIGPGDVQWMTAGSGIIHQEMPRGDAAGRMDGFQLWANLPHRLKMTAPRYQGVVAKDIPVVTDADGSRVRVICGTFNGTRGPIDGVAAAPIYLDISVAAGAEKTIPVPADHHAFAYVFDGVGRFCNAAKPLAVPTQSLKWADTTPYAEADNRTLVLFGAGDAIEVHAGDAGVRFLLVAGVPLREPVAWYGPIVMNRQEELQQAYDELKQNTFLKSTAKGVIKR